MKKIFLLGLVLILGLSSSCVSKKKFTDLESERDSLSTQLADAEDKVVMLSNEKAELETSNNQLESKVNQIEADLKSTQSEVSSLKKSVSEKEAMYNELHEDVTAVFNVKGIAEDAGFEVKETDDKLYLVLPELITFKSGSAKIHKDYEPFLEKLADMLKSNGTIHAIVEGHTDYRAILNADYKDNWDLSSQRAIAVAKKLIDMEVDVAQLTVAGKSDTMPLVQGEELSVDEMEKNRRVEFVLIPDISNIMPE